MRNGSGRTYRLMTPFTRRRFLRSITSLAAPACVLAAAGSAHGQGMSSRGVRPKPHPPFSGRPWPVNFIDAAPRAGLTAPVVYGPDSVKKYIYEANGPGIAFYDYDQDGWLDIFIPSGLAPEKLPADRAPTNRLYRNNRDGTFTDVTENSGLRHSGWCYGVCIGDYDNDGWDDLFLTYYGRNVLYHNNGNGTFTDVTSRAGLEQSRDRFASGCTFVDYDRDGRLDLFVSRYIDLDLATTPVSSDSRYCHFKGVAVNCGPLGLPKDTCSLFHNNGDGTFTDVTKVAGIDRAGPRYGLSAVALDYNNDGWPDIFVACDSSPNLLFRNNHDGTFAEVGMISGCAVSSEGQEQSGMGVGVGDYDGDGYLDLVLPHFFDDTPALYHNYEGKFFDDVTEAGGLGVSTQYVCWGTGFADFDNDGWPDILYVTGSVYPEVEKDYPDYPYKSPKVVFRNLGKGMFEEVSDRSGPAVLENRSSRGCAFGDFDNDGNLEMLILNMGEPPSLLKNTAKVENHWLSVKAIGTQSNRSAIGARITVRAGNRSQIREVTSGSSYLSQSDLRQHFGLGSATRVEEVAVRWPNGQTERIGAVPADLFITIQEGKGLLGQHGPGG
jgi:enediyne biosynthesis protein E4